MDTFFQAFYLPYKFGYDKRKAHLSSLIVSKQLSRRDAINELKKPLYDLKLLKDDKEFISKKLNISTQELENLIHNDPSRYSQFPNHQFKKKLSIKIYKLVKIIF